MRFLPREVAHSFTRSFGLVAESQQLKVKLGECLANKLPNSKLIVDFFVDSHPQGVPGPKIEIFNEP